ncbi:MAG: hypothetical protein WCK02_15295 [Bacteroidota bacterium]
MNNSAKKSLAIALINVLFITSVISQNVVIPDNNFKAALIAAPNSVDVNTDGEIQYSEAQVITSLYLINKSITNLTGIEAFSGLEVLDCSNNQITSLNLTSNTALKQLFCGSNDIITLNISSNVLLEDLWCYSNNISTIDISTNTALLNFYCYNNLLTSINTSNNTALAKFDCNNNDITSLDLSNNNALIELDCDNNLINNLTFSQNSNLLKLWCYSNKLVSINVSKNSALQELHCYNNLLTSLDVRNNNYITYLSCVSNPSLQNICVNNTQLGLTTSNPTSWKKDNTATWSTNCTSDIADYNDFNKPLTIINTFNLLGQIVNSNQLEDGIYINQYNNGMFKKIIISSHNK